MTLAYVLGDTCSYLLGEPLGEYRDIETIKTLNIYISAYQELHETVSRTQFHVTPDDVS